MADKQINYREMCLSLIRCESENEAIKILKRHNVWEKRELWRSYGDSENNWSIANNQMGTGVGALVELIVNSGDANLIGKCRESGMDPTDWDNVPQSIDQAVSDFFGISDLKFFEMTGQQRRQLAEKTCGLVVTGSKQNPNYGVFDFGEGQAPENFPATFLSLNESNKQSIPFVQGKFNQGSTGVLSYCGKFGLKLIVSKRNAAIEARQMVNGGSLLSAVFAQVKAVAQKAVRRSIYVPMARCLHLKPMEFPSSREATQMHMQKT